MGFKSFVFVSNHMLVVVLQIDESHRALLAIVGIYSGMTKEVSLELILAHKLLLTQSTFVTLSLDVCDIVVASHIAGKSEELLAIRMKTLHAS